MTDTIQDLWEKISLLDLPDIKKEALLAGLKQADKEYQRVDFSVKRTLKDKTIVVNLLEKTIEDLQIQQAYIEQTNQQLSEHQIEIEAKNKKLEVQKQLIEAHSHQLKENIEELENSYAELEQFSYIASHDLKSPLRTISGYARLLQRRYGRQLEGEANEFLTFIINGVKHMNDTICDLLEYSRAGKQEPHFVMTNLNQTIELVKFNLREEIESTNTQIIIRNELPKLFALKSGITQLFQNLIGNAIKFRSTHPPVITINALFQQTHWVVTVSDNGVGMDENFQHKAFQPFQRLNNIERPGTGMGLAICKKIVQMHNGTIRYASTNGAGTTFYITLAAENPYPTALNIAV
ncbi:MAG: ATP-binding protein [Saprospiraceae bacterium]